MLFRTQPTFMTDKLEPLIVVDGLYDGVKPEKSAFASVAAEPIPVDGCCGPRTRAALKSWLEAQNILIKDDSKSTCDGHCCCCCKRGLRGLDKETIKLLQSFLNEANGKEQTIPVDGWWGRRSGAALQLFLNNNPTAPDSRQLNIDGRARCRTTKAMQTFLNAHMAPAVAASA